MKKHQYFFCFALMFFLFIQGTSNAQLINTGSYLNIPSGTYVNAQCDILNENQGINTGIISNEGILITSGNVTNNGNFISGTSSTLKLDGSAQNLNGTLPYNLNNLEIDGTGNKNLNIGVHVFSNLIFNTNKVTINNHDIVLEPFADIANANFQRFVVTNGTGSLLKKSLVPGTDFLFPVGDAVSSYKPVILNTTGIADTFAVRVIQGVNPSDQTSVQKTYIIKESIAGSATAEVTLGWNTIDEGTSFQASQALIWQQMSGVWTAINTTPAGATPNAPNTDWKYAATGITFSNPTSDSLIIKSSAPPVINSHPQNQILCENGSATFSVSASGVGALSFQWQVNCSGTWTNVANGGTSPLYSGATDSILNISNIPFSQNSCQYQCIVTNVAGSTISNPATLTVHPSPFAAITGDTAICEGDTTILTVQTIGINYIWNTTETTSSITVNPLINQSYSVTVTDINTCTASTSVLVDVTPYFTVSITSDFPPNHEFLTGQIITFTASPTTYDNYEFFVNTSSVQSSSNNTYSSIGLQNGNIISVIATVNECTASDSLVVKVKPISNAFTPFDKNNKNDVFAKGVDLVIYNRWGQVLYTGVEGWDGTYNGKAVTAGTYYYIITMNEEQGKSRTLTGVVTLISNTKK